MANGKEQRKDMLRYRLITIDGNVTDRNRISGAIIQVDMVIARRPGSDKL